LILIYDFNIYTILINDIRWNYLLNIFNIYVEIEYHLPDQEATYFLKIIMTYSIMAFSSSLLALASA